MRARPRGGRRGRLTRSLFWLAPAALCAGVIGALGYAHSNRTAPPLPPEVVSKPLAGSLRLMSAFGPAFAGEMLALRGGLFTREGAQVDVRAGGSAEEAISSVVSGSDTFGVARADSFLLARARGAPIVAFAAAFAESRAAFYVLRKSRLRTPQDFAGRRIGRRAGDDTSLVYDALVARLRVPRSRIREVPVAADLLPLLRGDVDVWPGHVGEDDYVLEEKGADYAVIGPGSYGVNLLGTVYFASERTIAERSGLVQRFLKATIAGWRMAYQDYATSVPMIGSFDEKRLTVASVRFALDRQREYLRPLAFRYGEFNRDQWRFLQDVLLAQRLLEKTADLSEAVTYEFLRDAYRKPLAFAQ